MRAIGKKISNLATVRSLGLMEQFMKEIIKMERSMVMEFSNGQMVQSIKEPF